MSMPAVSKHLRVLERAGLIARGREAQWRPCRFGGRGPMGDITCYGIYREIDAPARLVFTEIYAPFPDAESIVTSEFTEEHGKTRLTVTARYPSVDVRNAVIKSGMEKGAAI